MLLSPPHWAGVCSKARPASLQPHQECPGTAPLRLAILPEQKLLQDGLYVSHNLGTPGALLWEISQLC